MTSQNGETGAAPSATPASASDNRSNNDNGESSRETGAFAEMLDVLGVNEADEVEVCWQRPGGRFEHDVAVRDVAVKLAAARSPEADVWFAVNPVRPPSTGRASESDVARCVALVADLDLKDGGVSDPETAEAVTQAISTALGQNPVALVFSGHGWHAYWALDAEDESWTLGTDHARSQARATYRRFHRLCAHLAELHGAGLDNVSQLNRLLRVPGTCNRKDPGHPVSTKLLLYPFGDGGPLSCDEVLDALSAHGIPGLSEDTADLGTVVSDAEGWKFGEQTEPYVAAMVQGWSTDRPGARHQWLMSQAVRMACAHRLGRITSTDHEQALAVLAERFAWVLDHGDKRPAGRGEVAGAHAWGRNRAATLSDAQAAAEIGGVGPMMLGGGAETDDTETEAGDPTRRLALPGEFWASRRSLQHIHDAALSRTASPDAVLGSALAWISASIPPSVRVDTGVLSPLPMHLFSVMTSDSGSGKSSGMREARKCLAIELPWSTDPFDSGESPVMTVDGEEFPHRAKPRSGEGIAEQFWGGQKVRDRVRSNVLLSTDEGSALVKFIKDDKSTVGETIREMWSGQDSGQSNAESARRRFIAQDSYTIAMLVGMQLRVVGDLLDRAELEKGTPQRFLFLWTRVDRERVAPLLAEIEDPGALTVTIPVNGLRLCPALREHVKAERLDQFLSGEKDGRPIESQRLAMVGRLAGLLAILDGREQTDEAGSLVVTEQDWQLAEVMFARSVAITDHAAAVQRAAAAKARQTERAVQLSEHIEDEDALQTSESRDEARLIGLIHAERGRAKWTGKDGLANCKFRGNRGAPILERLVAAGRVRMVATGRTTFVELVDD